MQERVVFIQNDAASGRLRLLITMNSEPLSPGGGFRVKLPF